MITEPRNERHQEQNHAVVRAAASISYGKYLQPAWDAVFDWMKQEEIQRS